MQQQELQRLQQQQHPEPSTLPYAGAPGRLVGSGGAWPHHVAEHGGGGALSVQLEVANAELRQQLQGTTSRLQDMEAAMARLLDQQVCLKVYADMSSDQCDHVLWWGGWG